MGLAAQRKRVKLAHDPNNTKWTRDTESFGHKTLAAQGWQPGDFLGAKKSADTGFHGAVNASHIRVIVKDDKLGLGAKRGSGLAEGECTGLYVFQSLLGRLNGKDEDQLAKEQESRETLKTTIYTGQRLGSVRFVKGGYLIGDKIQDPLEKEEADVHQRAQGSIPKSIVVRSETVSEDVPIKRKKEKREHRGKDKKSTKLALEDSEPGINGKQLSQASSRDISVQAVEEELKKSKKRRKQPIDSPGESKTPLPAILDEKRKVKKKRKRMQEHGKLRVKSPPATIVVPDASSTPQALLGGRHAIRSRNIAQKRLAVLDTASLNQIFMIKR